MYGVRRLVTLGVLLVPSVVVAVALRGGVADAAEVGCQVGNANPQQAWDQGPQNIHVDVDLSDPAAVTAVQAAFDKWAASPAGRSAQVTFTVSQLPLGGTPTGQYLVEDGTLTDGKAAATDIVPSPQTSRTHATTTLNVASGLNDDPDAVERIMAHEIGHTFGLPDATTNTVTGQPCQPGTSVMNPMNGDDPSASLDGPTVDDSNKVINGDGYGTGGGGGGPLPPCPRPYRPILDSGCNPSPIIIDVDGSGYQLTDASHGVRFDIYADGRPVRVSWTAPGSTNAFLVLDRNGDGAITDGRELFGDHTRQPASSHPNGFLALAMFDANHDGTIDSHDPIFGTLRLWQDTNHDAIADPRELHTLPQLGVHAIAVDYQRTGRVDNHANQYRYRAAVTGTHTAAWAYDVFFTVAATTGSPQPTDMRCTPH